MSDKWISVEERLPEPWDLNPYNSGSILTYRSGGVISVEAFWFEREEKFRKAAAKGDKWASPVTHWMPLPKPPKEQS